MSRFSGILLHPTSFPSPHGIGDLGKAAYQFVDFLHAAQQSLWQILPLGPTSYGNSPYQCTSAFAGNPWLISLETLQEQGYLTAEQLADAPVFSATCVDYAAASAWKMEKLALAYQGFCQTATSEIKQHFQAFCEQQQDWLDDFALFTALKNFHQEHCWNQWTPAFALRKKTELKRWAKQHAALIDYQKFLQFTFFEQWLALKHYANQRDIKIIGDIPIFVAYDSADVWAARDMFELDAQGQPTVVAGVPPDYFSETGQRWGNPLYKWSTMAKNDFSWWRQRVKLMLQLVDYVRIDHFRGFAAYWEIPATEETAIKGQWVKAPGQALFASLKQHLGELPIFAEDLGIITPDVEQLRDECGFPGMKVLQFAFFSENSDFLPHAYNKNTVVYTGTHDNNTTRGWFDCELKEVERNRVRQYVDRFIMGDAASDTLLRLAWASTANFALAPLQDILNLDESARMNTPGLLSPKNWTWRYQAEQLTEDLTLKLKELSCTYERNQVVSVV